MISEFWLKYSEKIHCTLFNYEFLIKFILTLFEPHFLTNEISRKSFNFIVKLLSKVTQIFFENKNLQKRVSAAGHGAPFSATRTSQIERA